MPRPVLRRSLEPEWQEAIRKVYQEAPDLLIEYLRSGKELDHWQRDELADLLDRMLRPIRSVRGRPLDPPTHDRLHRLRADIIAYTKRELQALRQRHGRVPYNGIQSTLNEAFRHCVMRYSDHNLTPRELTDLKDVILAKLRRIP
jgi:hypothetical protein